jgi:hypothetical protein
VKIARCVSHPATVTRVGLDLAKRVFQVHAVDAKGEIVVARKLTRNQLVPFFAALPPCVVAMEACERTGLLAAQPDLGPLRRTLFRLRHDFVMFGRAAAEPLSEALQARLGPLLLRIEEGAADHLRRSADALAARREPPPLETAEAAFDECARMIATLRDEGLRACPGT